MTPGLANKLCIPIATKVCCNFPETLQSLPADKAVLTGSPIRTELLHGNRLKGMELCGFNTSKPVIMVIGGSQGAAGINSLVRDALPTLLEDFQVVHVCGKDKIDNLLLNTRGYKQFEYVKEELKDLFAMADIVISRAGANAICELLALKKPNLLIPLPASASRGDQILNAKSFESQGFSMTADEDYLTAVTLTEKVHELYFTRQQYIDAMRNSKIKDSIETIVGLIEELVQKK
jgi:UDP-N-acetylglucosamine--N-acetylmuramyl-(pentapeptide) pyrophosphoryl-undecaprenol N-acetylglucosamine transferase